MVTAFALGELQAVIKETNNYHSREIERLPQQSQAQTNSKNIFCNYIERISEFQEIY